MKWKFLPPHSENFEILRKYIVFYSTSDQSWKALIVLQSFADALPQPLERWHAAREVDGGELLVLCDRVAKCWSVRWHKVANSGGHTSLKIRVNQLYTITNLLENLINDVIAENRRIARLPDNTVAHDRRDDAQVAADRREVERRDRRDESLKMKSNMSTNKVQTSIAR